MKTYLNIYEKLLEDIGNKIELENPFYCREESDLDGIEVGMRLNLYTYDSPMGKEASVITPKDKEIYLPPIVSLNIAEPLEKGWIKGVAEVVSIEPVQDNPNKNTVYIKIVLDK